MAAKGCRPTPNRRSASPADDEADGVQGLPCTGLPVPMLRLCAGSQAPAWEPLAFKRLLVHWKPELPRPSSRTGAWEPAERLITCVDTYALKEWFHLPKEASPEPNEGSRLPNETSPEPHEGSRLPNETSPEPHEGSRLPNEAFPEPSERSPRPSCCFTLALDGKLAKMQTCNNKVIIRPTSSGSVHHAKTSHR